jgi:hypothetical protein
MAALLLAETWAVRSATALLRIFGLSSRLFSFLFVPPYFSFIHIASVDHIDPAGLGARNLADLRENSGKFHWTISPVYVAVPLRIWNF